MGNLSHMAAIVTGASRGIGRGIARGLAAEGASVVLAGRDEERLAVTAEQVTAAGGKSLVCMADVSSEADVERLFATAVATFGRVDLVVNNAGVFDGGPLEKLSVETWDKVMSINLRGPFLCTRAAMRLMKPQGGGRIINVASISAMRVRPNSAPYSTTKHGLWGLTQVTALEGRGHGITCCCLNPGNVRIERRQNSGRVEDEEPMMEVDDIARVAVLMASLPKHVEMLEAVVLPAQQLFVGRG